MLAKRTIIGFIVGSLIIGIGVYSLITGFGFQTVEVNETFGVGESTSYQIKANNGASQKMKIIGDSFDLEMNSPGDGLQIPNTSYKKELSLEWVHLEDGITFIEIQNTGSTDFQVTATLNVTTDPILFTYHLVVITAGVIIIGFSMGFTLRKPKGF
ncbi:MAG: hypothetical protein H2A90_03745 [Nitrosopumilaceae archaeon]|nr:hypothetical protein [Nitrosopumilaceae archaeon]RMW33968.1 MAG: hypothetical protein EA443_06435 [Nitrosopumilus sp.]